MSKSDLPDLEWIITKLRGLLDEYERTARSDDDWHVMLQATYRHRDTGKGITLVLGTEPAAEEDEEDDDA